MSDNNRGSRSSYSASRPRRRYVVKRPLYKQPIVYVGLVALVVFIILGIWLVTRNSNDVVTNPGATAQTNITSTLSPDDTPDPDATDADGLIVENATPSVTEAPTPAPTVNEGPLVWDTPNGSQFHFDQTCKGMSGATQETMMAAYNRGLQPCERCVTSESATAERPAITVRALTGLPSSLGNVVIQDPQVFDVMNVAGTVGTLGANGPTAFNVTGTTSGGIALLYTNQPDSYNIRVRALLTDASNNIVWDDDEAPEVTLCGLEMPRSFSLLKEISTTDVTGLKLTVLVYASDGFEGVDADMAVLGMYQTTM